MKASIKNKLLGAFFIFSCMLLLASTQLPPWDVPAEANDIINPTEVNKKTLDAGKVFYEMNCLACHGATGLGDGVIPSGNMTIKAFTDQTDGALFYKLQEGRGLMPSFRTSSDTDLWHVINYIRTFAAPVEEILRKNAVVLLEFNESDSVNTVVARVYEILDNGERTPAREIRVSFYIKRYFADMLIGGNRNYTGSEGSVSIAFPQGIPGENGLLEVIARVEDSEYYPAEAMQEIAWGIEKKTYWNEKRELWKDNDYVPLWLLISFFGTIAGIMGVILYVLLQVKKIRKLGA
jgi:mono/diheme cytochrome c family protein